MLFKLEQQKEKVILSVLATVLFFYCQNTMHAAPLITLSDEVNNTIYQSVVFFIMLELVVSLAMFNQQIRHHEHLINARSTTDSLTNYLNRNYFFVAGQEQVDLANLNSRPFSLILINLDNFKRVNDEYGYLIADEYLVFLAKLIDDMCIKGEIVGRLSGEEFAITLPEHTKTEAEKHSKKLSCQIETTPFICSDNRAISNTVSMGVVVHNSSETSFDCLNRLNSSQKNGQG